MRRPGSGPWSAYGVTFQSHHPFRFHLTPASRRVDLTFELVDEPPLADGWDALPSTFTSRDGTTGVATADVRLVDGWHVLRFMDAAHFFVRDDLVLCVLHQPAYRFAIDIWFLGSVLTYWLELRGVPVLHAASVEVPGGAVAFLADHGAGKSTLVASFVAAGSRLMGDDVVPLEPRDDHVWLRPGYPQMRFWPEQAERLLGSVQGLERVQPGSAKLFARVGDGVFGSFCDTPRPLVGLYLPQRTDGGEVSIERLGFAEGVTSLVRYSFLSGLVEASGLRSARFSCLADVVRRVPVRRLRYPSGLEHLADVRAAVLADAVAADRAVGEDVADSDSAGAGSDAA